MTRAVVFAMASYLTVWAVQNYQSNRHLQVMNDHRSKALQTFDAFVWAADDDGQTRNAVLLEATRCIFTAGSTGYSSDETAGPTDGIVEIVKGFADRR
jgi:hypothetical protein